MKQILFILAISISCGMAARALTTDHFVGEQKSRGAFCLFANGAAADIVVESNDWKGVQRAADDLRTDIKRVSAFVTNISSADIIVVGTAGRSELIDRLVREGKVDVSSIAGKWESFLIQTVREPLPGVKNGLVICGSDKRGTIYGIYDVSEQMGVSPWHFFADVPSKHHDKLFVKAGTYIQGPPTVKYRGIFINDEAPDLTGWVKEHYGNYNHGFYTNVFELLLRLRANYLWPAMWDNCFSEDDPLNYQLADEYGIVMGTSHVEPMMRADKEWDRAGYSAKEWNFQTHSNELMNFWREGVERNKDCENIITIAMRGKIDTAMSPTANVALLEEIVAAQRNTIADVYHTNAAAVPQLWALYKEVQEYYEKGMRVPDDVTLLWCDDNWGNLRRVPSADARQRRGGSGIYYHIDYVGSPRNYKWVNSVSIPRIWEQMGIAHAYGANQIWIANVGHLQHVQLPMEFFLTYAWNPDAWPKEKMYEFTQLWAEREFGPKFAPQIADIVSQFTQFNARRKPELLSPATFSVTNYDEAEKVAAAWQALAVRAQNISEKLPADRRDAFFELVMYPVKACANLQALYVAAAKNRFYGGQGLAIANDFAKEVRQRFETDRELSNFYNRQLAGGKWDHMMDQTHIGYTRWQQPDTNNMPALVDVASPMPPKKEVIEADNSTPAGSVRKKSPLFFKGFIEENDYVSIDAVDFSRKVNASSAHWESIIGLGNTGAAMAIFPVTAPSVTPPADSPHLEYKIYFYSSGAAKVECRIAPTLNFISGRGLRFGISMDDEPPQIVTAVPESYSVGSGDFNRDWAAVVADDVRKVTTTVTLKAPGVHTLKLWMVDPGVVLEKIIVDCGGVKPSYLGPPESFKE